MVPMMRAAIIGNVIAIVIPSALWIASVHVETPRRQGLIWVAIIIGQSERSDSHPYSN